MKLRGLFRSGQKCSLNLLRNTAEKKVNTSTHQLTVLKLDTHKNKTKIEQIIHLAVYIIKLHQVCLFAVRPTQIRDIYLGRLKGEKPNQKCIKPF